MPRWSLLTLAVLAVGCGSPSGTDAGGGGGGTATGGGGSTGGGGGTTTGGGGGSTTGGGGGTTAWDGGSTWTLVGPVAPTVGWMTSGFQSFDGGWQDARRFTALYFDHPGVTACTSPNPPFDVLEVRVELEDGGVVVPGTYQLGPASIVTYTRYTSVGMALEPGGLGITGSVTITRFDGRSSAGSFSTTLSSWADGGTTPLSGTWDTGVLDCP